MKKINLQNIDIDLFEKTFERFKKFVVSDFEFNFTNFELSTKSEDFDKWHLVTLGSFYGGNLFRKNNKLEIHKIQECKIPFKISYTSPKINLTTEWNNIIEITPGFLNSAEPFLTEKLENQISEKSKMILKNALPFFNFNQSPFFSEINNNNLKYAYFIIKENLIFIKVETENAEITTIFKISWNEI